MDCLGRWPVAGALLFFVASLLPNVGQWVVLGVVGWPSSRARSCSCCPSAAPSGATIVPKTRIDERDIMFARARLEPGTPNYEAYYALRPENKAGDDKTRSLPGLLSPEASEANPLVFAATDASFEPVRALRDAGGWAGRVGAD